jgi:photosystem II stability/assembly factor-like uncharacterized protein
VTERISVSVLKKSMRGHRQRIQKMNQVTGKLMALITVMVSVAGAAAAQGAYWTERSSGLPVSRAVVNRLFIHPKDGTLFGLTDDGLFKSTDGGQHWAPVMSITGIQSLVMDPENSGTIYAATGHGVLKTANAGRSWIAADKGLPGIVNALVMDFQDSTILYALSNDGVFKTSDGAASWNPVGQLDANSSGLALATGPGNPGTVYLVYYDRHTGQGKIATSTDGGITWSPVPVPSNILIRSLTIDPSSPSTIYATSYATSISLRGPFGSIFKTTDGGANWEGVNDLPQNDSISSIVIDPAAPSTLYATYTFQTLGGILKSTDGGASFGPIGMDVIPYFSHPTLAIDPATSTVYAAYNSPYGSGVLKSRDAGNSWEEADSGLEYIDVSLMTVDPVNSSTVYSVAPVGPVTPPTFSSGQGIYRSIDGGSSWASLAVFPFPAYGGLVSGPAQIRSILVDYFDPNTLYALTGRRDGCVATDHLLFKSADGGATWSARFGQPSGCLFIAQWGPIFMTMDPTNPSTLYLGEYTEGEFGLTRSVDGGANWSEIFRSDTDFTDANYLIAIDPTNSDVLYLGLQDYNVGGVRKSVDGGATWVSSGLTGPAVTVMAIDPTGSAIYASTEGVHSTPAGFRGLFKSTDGGANWIELSRGLETLRNARIRVTSILTGPPNSNILFIGTAGAGVFRSTDGGATWNAFNDGLGNLNVRVLAMSRNDPSVLYAGTAGGVFEITLPIVPVPVVTDLRFDRSSVAAGSSYSANFSGANLTEETFFDVRFIAPGSNDSVAVLNWQKGLALNHSVPAGTASGIWTINGVRAHQIETDHGGNFVPVSAMIAVSP